MWACVGTLWACGDCEYVGKCEYTMYVCGDPVCLCVDHVCVDPVCVDRVCGGGDHVRVCVRRDPVGMCGDPGCVDRVWGVDPVGVCVGTLYVGVGTLRLCVCGEPVDPVGVCGYSVLCLWPGPLWFVHGLSDVRSTSLPPQVCATGNAVRHVLAVAECSQRQAPGRCS